MIKISSMEPDNFIYPYLSKRKVVNYEEQINIDNSSKVVNNFRYLYAKIDKISNPNMPAYKLYMDSCEDIFGYTITCTPSGNGKKASYVIDNFNNIKLDSMGEGIVHILGLLVDLCIAENKLFIIEEPETEIHPKALKKLLKLIVDKSNNNQFIITTHSNIVVKHLGTDPKTRLIYMDMELENNIPISKVKVIENTTEERQDVLEHLGYEFTDIDLWEGLLILEESSAEKIIKDYLIPWFIPVLCGKLRTYSAKTIDNIESKFDDFNTLFCFLNLQSAYKNKAWVIIDGGNNKEKDIIQHLKNNYGKHGWNEEHFQQFNEHDFEKYYPEQFQEKVNQVLLIRDRTKKFVAKKSLLQEVLDWTNNNPQEAKDSFQESASEIISKLKEIEKQIIQ